jgi:hypothetical protein
VPFRLDSEGFDGRAKVQFTTSAAMPTLIYQACLATGTVSNTVYCQHALVQALARDLGLDVADLVADLPQPRGPSAHLWNPEDHTLGRYERIRHGIALDPAKMVRIGPANTDEEVR